MKRIDSFINEKLRMNTKTISKQKHSYFPETKEELHDIIEKLIKERGDKANLNDIDTSMITDMSLLFSIYFEQFNGDISQWDVSNVKKMYGMFDHCEFDGDISDWDVSNVEDMSKMFYKSKFNGDLSKWDVSNVKYMSSMFEQSWFSGRNGDISNWNLKSIRQLNKMFYNSGFEGNTGKWKIPDECWTGEKMLDRCASINYNKCPEWYDTEYDDIKCVLRKKLKNYNK